MKLFFGKLLCTLQQLRANSKSKWGRWVYDGGGLGLLASRQNYWKFQGNAPIAFMTFYDYCI